MESINIPKRDKIRVKLLSHKHEDNHFHRDFEVLFLLNGEMLVTIDGVEYKVLENNFIIINSNSQHGFISANDVLFLKISINYELIRDIVGDKAFYFRNDIKNQPEGVKLAINKLLYYYLNRQTSQLVDFAYLSICYNILDSLSEYCLEISDLTNNQTLFGEQTRIYEINDYINSNYNQGITLQGLSDYLYLTPSYLSKYFKRKFGMNFKRYLTDIQLNRAYDDIIFTDKTIKNIAFDNGFTNITHFSQKFSDKFGYPPKEFKMRRGQSETIEKYSPKADEKAQIKEYLDQYSKGETQAIVVETSALKTAPLPRNWENMINIGQVSDLLDSTMQEHILLLKNKLGFQYVRFWNIFSRELLIFSDGETVSYNFTKINQIFDFLVKNNIKPHIEIEMKPKIISKNAKHSVRIEENPNVFSGRTLGRIVDNFLKHLVGRYGIGLVEQWRFELWFNEWQKESELSFSEYFEKFSILFSTCKKYSSRLKVGGCGYAALYSGHLGKDFFEKWSKETDRPDFISITSYSYERVANNDEFSSVKSRNSNILSDGIKQTERFLNYTDFRQIPVYVTEWNLSFSDRNFINDTCFKGSYILENVINNLDYILSYHYSSDQISEYFDSGGFLYGGLGLITKETIFKPAAHAFEFLHKLNDFYFEKSNNYLMTTDKNDNYTIICYNKQELTSLYYATEEDALNLEFVEQYYLNREKNYNFIIHDIVSGKYKMKIRSVSSDYGSILDEWKKLNFYENLSLNDIDYLKGASIPKLTILEVESQNNQLELNLKLKPNEFVMIKLKKI